VLVEGLKVCGILIEQGRGTVVGIGLNVHQTAAEFAAAELPFATSLNQHAEANLETAAVARLLIQELDAGYDLLCQGDLASLEASWKGHVGLLDQAVRVECHEGLLQGRLTGLGFDGLTLHQADGDRVKLLPEKVLHLSPL
jgi:BirA family biotin operon repressor/biotin-[acetyl-CoA-carboxylase] ligase